MSETNVLIIGGGPAGYVAAIRARQLGAKVTLVEKDALGGTCLNRGCIPTRALVRGVELLDLPKKAKEYGITYPAPEVDFARMIARKDTIIKTVGGGVQLLLKENGVEVLKGEARLVSRNEVEARTASGTSKLTANRIVIATGAHQQKPAVPGADTIITTTEALTLNEVPPSMLVLAAGPIGITFAVIFARLGSSVTVAHESAQILPGFDREIVGLLERELRKEKVKILTEASLKEISGESVTVTVKGKEEAITTKYVLVADSRVPNIEGLGLENAGITLINGHIKVNNRLETDVPGIYAAGDVAGGPMLAQAAFTGGRIAAENALGKSSTIDFNTIPRCVYTFPEIACVGLTEEEATTQGYQVRTGRFPFSANGLATVLGERTGLVKVVSDTKYGQILGVHILGPSATELISEAVLAMRLEEPSRVIGSTVHAHPTLSEALMEAMLDVSGETLHFISKNPRE
ncbi:MAG: dihydrolipoyl dehydrogenase [Dehalococcoidia bacterium]|nr:dihydrolipoyl dehydrogenase [Dehalococcoidia bacterium]